MATRRDPTAPIDISQKLRVIRDFADIPQFGDDAAAATESLKLLSVVKKTFNIPICDVKLDQDYDNIVKATFRLPESYVRHVRRIGDEADITIDYNMEMEDKIWLANSKLAADKDMKYVTPEAFETVINILERHTGLSRDPIPQAHADKLVTDALRWAPPLTAKVLPELYDYWLRKREKLNKPLCRKYWPQTPATDNNPHLTFRPRDKERYRLRKQQRRNDIDSFRKMQQLRREFARADMLLQLIMEREQLKKAALDAQQEIFEQIVYELGVGGKGRPPRKAVPFRYALLYEHLLFKDDSFKVDALGEADKEKLMSQSSRQSSLGAAALRNSENEVRKQKKLVPSAASIRRKRDDAAGGDRPSGAADLASGHSEAGGATLDSVHPAVPGPKFMCRHPWTPFMLPQQRETACPILTVSDYLDALEFRDDEPLPTKFRCSMRVGRCGRLVMDRIPCYPHSSASSEIEGSYVYPTMLHSRLLKGLPAPAASGSGGPHTQLQPHKPLYTLPPSNPPERASVSTALHMREKDIYMYSDDEDEERFSVDLLPVTSRKVNRPAPYTVLSL